MSGKNIYTAPESDLSIESIDGSKREFFPTSQRKLVILYIATFGYYTVYWFYKNWELYRKNAGKKILPLLRAIFYIFYTHSLFRRVEEAAMNKGISKSWGANRLATGFVILIIISYFVQTPSQKPETSGFYLRLNVSDFGIWDFVSVAIFFILLSPIYMVQEVVNKLNDDPQGRLNSSFSIYNFIFIIIGALIWMLLGILFFQL